MLRKIYKLCYVSPDLEEKYTILNEKKVKTSVDFFYLFPWGNQERQSHVFNIVNICLPRFYRSGLLCLDFAPIGCVQSPSPGFLKKAKTVNRYIFKGLFLSLGPSRFFLSFRQDRVSSKKFFFLSEVFCAFFLYSPRYNSHLK